MSLKISNIAKNTSYFTIALILQKIISFSYFAIIARVLGPEDLGKYYFAISFTTIFSIFIDFGFANVITREVAKKREKAQEFLSNTIAVKFILSILSLAMLVFLINIMGYPELTKDLVYLSAICMVLDSFTATFFSVMRGFHNLSYESIASVVFQIIVLGYGLLAIKLNLGLRWLMGSLVSASIFNFIYSSLLVRYRWGISLRPAINRSILNFLIKISIPFGLYLIFQRAYTYLDTVLLSVLAGDTYVGLYQISFKIIFAIQFLPLAFMASLYPAFASYWKTNREQLIVTFERSMNYLIIISLPISIGIIALADKIIAIFKSEYTEAIFPLQLIMVSLLFIFINYPVGSLLNACDKQKTNTINIGITFAISVLMNLILIPLYKTAGASITVVFTNIIMFILGMYWVPKIIKYRPKKIILTFIKSVLSASIMGAAAIYLKGQINIFFTVFISGFIYLAILFMLKGFSAADVLSIWRSFIKSRA